MAGGGQGGGYGGGYGGGSPGGGMMFGGAQPSGGVSLPPETGGGMGAPTPNYDVQMPGGSGGMGQDVMGGLSGTMGGPGSGPGGLGTATYARIPESDFGGYGGMPFMGGGYGGGMGGYGGMPFMGGYGGGMGGFSRGFGSPFRGGMGGGFGGFGGFPGQLDQMYRGPMQELEVGGSSRGGGNLYQPAVMPRPINVAGGAPSMSTPDQAPPQIMNRPAVMPVNVAGGAPSTATPDQTLQKAVTSPATPPAAPAATPPTARLPFGSPSEPGRPRTTPRLRDLQSQIVNAFGRENIGRPVNAAQIPLMNRPAGMRAGGIASLLKRK